MYTLDFNDDAAQRALNRVAEGLADLTPMMQEIAEFLTTSTKDRFAEGKAPDGTPWAPKSQTTLDAYAARHDRIDTRSLFGPSGMLSQQIFAEITPDSVRWGSPMIYSAVMQGGAAKAAFGPRTPWGDIPARPFLGISEADRTGLIDIASEYLASLTQGD